MSASQVTTVLLRDTQLSCPLLQSAGGITLLLCKPPGGLFCLQACLVILGSKRPAEWTSGDVRYEVMQHALLEGLMQPVGVADLYKAAGQETEQG